MKKTISIAIIMTLMIAILGGCVNAASSISASTRNLKEGENVRITVSFGEKVSAAQFTLNFDSNKFTYVSKSSGGSFSGATKKFAYTSEDGVTADLSSVTFTFKAKSEGTANFSISGMKISTATQTKITPAISSSSVSVTVETEKVEEPTTPSTPSTPTTPTTPSTPTTPITPSTPNNGTATDKNTTSNKPSNTNTNNDKETPKIENVVENKIVNNEQTNIIEETTNTIKNEETINSNEIIDVSAQIQENNSENNNMLGLIGVGILVIGVATLGIIVIIIKRKKQEDESEEK